MTRRLVLAALISVLGSGLVSPADADEAPPSVAIGPEIGGEAVGPGADATFVVPKAEIEEARAEAQANPEDLTSTERHAEDILLEASEKAGGSLDEDSVDVVSLVDGDVVLAVPATIEISEISVDINGGVVDVSAIADESDEAAATGGGPGMAPYWANDGDGQYVLTVRGLGNALFVWKREKLMNDGSSAYTWYSYKRKGDAHPFERTGPNARVKKLRVQSYPYDQIESGLVNWVDWEPAADFHGNEGTPITVSVAALGVGTSITFADRDDYNVWRNANNPGSYWIEMDQGYFVDGGSRAAGYAVAWKAKQGTPGSQHDFQRVVFVFGGENYPCDEYDASDTCTPNGWDH